MGEWDDMLGRGEYAPIDWKARAEQAKADFAKARDLGSRHQLETEAQRERAERAEATIARTLNVVAGWATYAPGECCEGHCVADVHDLREDQAQRLGEVLRDVGDKIQGGQ